MDIGSILKYNRSADALAAEVLNKCIGDRWAPLGNMRVYYDDYAMFRVVAEEIWRERVYDFDLSKSPFIVDAGANIGVATLRFKHLYPDCKVLCFEPSRDNYHLLTKNLRVNHIAGVEAHCVALSDHRGVLSLNGNDGHSTAPGILHYGDHDGFLAECDRLSNHVEGMVDLLKLDVEGSEEAVIMEMAESGKLKCVRRLIMEYHYARHGNSLEKIIATLDDNGFSFSWWSRGHSVAPLHTLNLYAARSH
jgi:FkbM family methyltransferase